jgi:formate dehydrogenase alpha subunit
MNELVRLQIDGQEVAVPKGVTIIEAAARARIDIPHLCHLSGLVPSGACRLCLVELEGNKELVVSCARGVREGMVVWTRTERVLAARRFVLELIWSVHPGDCTTCEKSGRCELQKHTYELGVERNRFPLRRDEQPVDTTNPLIERDPNLCILCGRCVRICRMRGGNNVFDFVGRGITTRVTTAFDKPLQESGCTFCGSCISVCPVGSLVERQRRFRGREWEFKTTETVCSYCGGGCKLLLDTTKDQIVRARTEKRDDYLCARGKFGWDYVLSRERLKTPLIKKEGTLEECSWDEALSYIAKRMLKIKETRGPNALGGLISANYPSETLYLFGKFIRAGLGTNNLDSSVRLLSWPTLSGFIQVFGRMGVISTLSEIEAADTLLVLDSDVTVKNPMVGVKVKKALKTLRKGAKLVTIDPRKTEVAKLSHLHLQLRAGTTTVLLDGIIKVILSEGLYDQEFVAANCSNFQEFSTRFLEMDIDIEAITGVTEEAVLAAGRLYAEQGQKAVIIFSPETSDRHTVARIVNLLLLTGRVNGGAFPSLLLSNLWGAAEVGVVSEFYPGYRPVEAATARKELESLWGVSLPSEPGLSAIEMIQAAAESVFGMYILGENPAASFPDTANMVKGLAALDFLVVQDIFLTETAQLADVVLPGVSFAESAGTFTNAEGKVQEINRVLPPQTRPDWKVIAEISTRMGYPSSYHSEREIAAELKTLVPEFSEPRNSEPGTQNSELKTQNSKLRLVMTEAEETSEEPDHEYPYRLMTGATLFGFGDGSWTKRSEISKLETPYIGISPQDAQSLGVASGVRVAVSSRRGRIITTVKVEASLPAGLVFMPAHHPGGNSLTNASLDPVTKSPRLELAAVSINRLQESESENQCVEDRPPLNFNQTSGGS